MLIAKKIKLLRENKNISQEYIAQELGLSQSQYSRRESGKVKFLAEEIGKLAKFLDISVSDIYGEQTNSFHIRPQNDSTLKKYIQVSEKLMNQYEARLKEKDEIILLLRK